MNSSPFVSTPIERVSAIDPREFAIRFEQTGTPCVIAGGVRDWRATQTWNRDYLREKLGHVEVQFKVSTRHTHPDFHQSSLDKMFARGKSPFGAFLSAITEGPREERARRLFTGDEQFILQRRNEKTTYDESLRPLLDDIVFPKFVPSERLYTVWGWFSGGGVRTWLHYDNNGCHNLNAQITGTKRCLLFAPRQLSRLFPFPLGGKNPAYNCSQIDVEFPDVERFPEFRDVPCFEATLEPGDLLFIPAWWFHTFLHVGDLNSNVNFWWKPEEPVMNEVAARQMLLDVAAAAKAKLAGATTPGELLELLDQAAIARRM